MRREIIILLISISLIMGCSDSGMTSVLFSESEMSLLKLTQITSTTNSYKDNPEIKAIERFAATYSHKDSKHNIILNIFKYNSKKDLNDDYPDKIKVLMENEDKYTKISENEFGDKGYSVKDNTHGAYSIVFAKKSYLVSFTFPPDIPNTQIKEIVKTIEDKI